jgi:type II secretory pathway pseudopilin PulG
VRSDSGETLIEVLMTVVIIGMTFTALFTSLATAGNAGNVGRSSAQTDVVLRNYAEAAKLAVQGCVAGGLYTVVYPLPTQTLPAGFVPSMTAISGGAVGTCPAVAVPQVLQLKVVGPLAVQASMQIKVRTP